MNAPGQTILAFESAIAGGSISLQRSGVEIASWAGSSNVSKAEDLLFNIDEMLSSAEVSRHDIDLIAVSAGPGSFTGIRIGIATGLGFKTGLGVKMSSVSVMKAIASGSSINGLITIAVPVGRNSVCVQRFKTTLPGSDAVDEPHTLSDDQFSEYVRNENSINLILHPMLAARFELSTRITNIGLNLAFFVGQFCSRFPDTVTEPLFISKSF